MGANFWEGAWRHVPLQQFGVDVPNNWPTGDLFFDELLVGATSASTEPLPCPRRSDPSASPPQYFPQLYRHDKATLQQL